jgi:putative ABC transport system permease protein
MKVLMLIALRNLTQAKWRTLFLGSALALVTWLLVLLMGLSQGISDNIIRSATTLTTGHVNVAGFFKASPSQATPLVTDASKVRALVERSATGVDYVVSRQRGWARVVSPTGALQSLLVGVDIADEPTLPDVLEMADPAEYLPEGRKAQAGPGSVRELDGENTAVIFATQAKRLEVGVGDRLTLRTQTMSGASNTMDVTVVAVARDIGLLSNFSVFVPRQVVLDLYQLKPDTTGALQIYLEDIDRSDEVMAQVRGALEAEDYRLMEYQAAPFFAKFSTANGEDWIGQKIDLTIWEDEVDFLTWILTALDTVSFGLVAILVVIIAVGVMNTMWIAVRKRTTEVGTLRAIGMSRGRVLAMFLLEAAALGFAASSVGAIFGAAVAAGVNAAEIRVPVDAMRAILLSDTFTLSVTPGGLVGAVVMLTAFTTLSALAPAIRAARLQPVEAIQTAE